MRAKLSGMGSNLNENSIDENSPSLIYSIGIITDSPENPENVTHFSVTTALTYCKTKILKPYLRFLCITGLRSFVADSSDRFTLKGCCCHLYIIALLILIILGYLLQYTACFRRDRGFCYLIIQSETGTNLLSDEERFKTVCEESIIFSYGIPHILHFFGYAHAFHVFRSSNDDQLPSLMESVFLTLTNLSNGFQSQKKLVRMLWIFVAINILWMISSLSAVMVMMLDGTIEFKWINYNDTNIVLILKLLLVLSTLCHDVVQATVISNYCLQAQLLTNYVRFLKEKLLQHSVLAMEWMRDMEEFKKLLHFLNAKLSPSVCIFTLLNVSRSITGTLWLFNLDNVDRTNSHTFWICLINILLWVVLALSPFIQAARLTNSCYEIRGVGHELRARPYPVHSLHNDNSRQLDTLMLYSSTLKYKATLFGLSIKLCYIYFLLTATSLLILALGQLHYLK
ncbi:uncharacterized protein [Onthophagus taurus]|uniref:uncharacterized protein isoform X2 n=1 Tax=Onthophagus taurus TaxID=166361 RepID=UPI000C208CEA|nr:uncharacterized protein LOC111414632 isoform X2 [Onthophagus taurus]